jgi:hypothetical protein
VSEAAAFAAWLGGAILVLADGRRGLALGLALMAAGLGGVAFAAGEQLTGAALLAGGVVAAALRWRTGPEGWGLMQPGSTPRIVLTVVIGLVALYFAASLSSGEGAALRFAPMACIALAGARLLQGAERGAALTAASGLVLALGAGSVLGSSGSLPAAVVAAVIAAGASTLPAAEPHGA